MVKGLQSIVLKLANGQISIVSDQCGTSECSTVDENFSYLWNDNNNDMCEKPYSTVCSHGTFHAESISTWVDDTWDHYKDAEYRFHEREKDILEASSPSDSLKRAHEFYASCMESETDHYTTVLEASNKIITESPVSQWPIMHKDSPNETKWEPSIWWQKLDEYYLAETGESSFHDFSETISHGDEPKHVIIMRPPKFVIPKHILLKIRDDNAGCDAPEDPHAGPRQAYSVYIKNTLLKIYPNLTADWMATKVCESIDRIIQFEANLADISMPEKEIQFYQPRGSPPNFTELQQWYNHQLMFHDYTLDEEWIESSLLHLARSFETTEDPFKINWEQVVAELWETVAQTGEKMDREIHKALVDMPHKTYYLKLNVLLGTTDSKVIDLAKKCNLITIIDFMYEANYMHWRFLRSSLLRTKTGAEEFEKLAELMGFAHILKKPRWLKCVEENVLKEPIHSELMKKQKPQLDQINAKIRNMYDGIVMSTIDRQIMQDSYRKNTDDILENHLNKMSINIFGEQTLLSDYQNSDLPSRVNVTNYFDEYVTQQKWRIKSIMKKITKSTDGKIWPVSPDRAGVFVTTKSGAHQLYLPGAILQKPFFDLNQESVYNYAGVGAEIATVIWQSALLPGIFPEETYQWVKTCFSLNETFPVANITEQIELRIFMSGRQSLDGVQIALDAFGQDGRHEDTNGMGFLLHNSEKQFFLAAYIATQCEYVSSSSISKDWGQSISGTKPEIDRIGLRNVAIYYPFKDDSTSKFRIDTIGNSSFYNKIFICDKNRSDIKYC